MAYFLAVFFFSACVAQAASIIQGAVSTPSDLVGFHGLIDLIAPINSFAAGVLWTKLAGIKEDIERVEKSYTGFRDEITKEIISLIKADREN